jgi:phage shock protein A
MTTLLEKVTTLLSANAHALVDQALKSNSLAVIDQYLRQAADNLASLDDATATVGGELKTLDRRLAGQQQTAAELDKAVDAFLLRRDETAARSAQSRLNNAQTLIETYQQHRTRLQAEYDQLRAARLRLEARFDAMKQQRQELQALLELARSKELVVRTIRGLDDLLGSGDSDLSALAQSIYGRLDKATAATELHATSLDAQIDALMEREALDQQLALRREKLELPAAPVAQ